MRRARVVSGIRVLCGTGTRLRGRPGARRRGPSSEAVLRCEDVGRCADGVHFSRIVPHAECRGSAQLTGLTFGVLLRLPEPRDGWQREPHALSRARPRASARPEAERGGAPGVPTTVSSSLASSTWTADAFPCAGWPVPVEPFPSGRSPPTSWSTGVRCPVVAIHIVRLEEEGPRRTRGGRRSLRGHQPPEPRPGGREDVGAVWRLPDEARGVPRGPRWPPQIGRRP